MTLHEAIAETLREAGHILTTAEIAAEVNRRRSYLKRAGTPVTAFQVRGRTKNYSGLFTRDRTLVGLCEWCGRAKMVGRYSSGHSPGYSDRADGGGDIGPGFVPSRNQDVGKLTFLEASGFVRLGTVAELMRSGLPRDATLGRCGVYAIATPASYVPEYVLPNAAEAAGNVIRPWPRGKLAGRWVEGANIVYYGVAGRHQPRPLRERLDDLVRHASGRTTDRGPHKGGEIVWQLVGYEDFSVWAFATPDPPAPRLTEVALLSAFEARYHASPFGNRQA